MGTHDGHRARLRERFLQDGFDGFNDINSLELLLFYALPRCDTNEIAHALLDRFGSLKNVLNAPIAELTQVNGIGESAAILIQVVSGLSRKVAISDTKKSYIKNSSDAADYLRALFFEQPYESIYLICMDASRKVLRCKELSRGGISSVEFNIRQAIQEAISSNSVSLILSHNHPGGVCRPSEEDLEMTRRFTDALRPFGDLHLDDHFIIAGENYFSFADNGLI